MSPKETVVSALQGVQRRIEATLRARLAFTDPIFATLGSLWAMGTHAYQSFDAYPYLVITAATKRAGKSIFADILCTVSKDGKPGSSMTASVMRRLVSKGSTLFFDEAESLNSEAASAVREFLNIGYRAGQCVYMPGTGPDDVIEYPAYSPKAFILIGDVNDTLRDRSIVIEMKRGTPAVVYRRTEVESEAASILADLNADALRSLIDGHVYDAYRVLSDREAEIWTPIFTLASILTPDKLTAIIRTAVDLSALKQTTDKRRFSELRASEEARTADAHFGERAIHDLAFVMGLETALHMHSNPRKPVRAMFTDTVIDQMKAIDTAPWRTYRGPSGLNAHLLSYLVNRYCQTRWVKIAGKSKRGFQAADVRHGLAKLGKDKVS